MLVASQYNYIRIGFQTVQFLPLTTYRVVSSSYGRGIAIGRPGNKPLLVLRFPQELPHPQTSRFRIKNKSFKLVPYLGQVRM